MRWLDGIISSMDVSLSKLWETEKPNVLQSMGLQEADTTEQLNNNRIIIRYRCLFSF